MTMTHEEARARLSALLDEALPAQEAVRVRAHLDTCATCAAVLEELRATVAMVRGVEPVGAPQGFADRVRARLAALPQPHTMPAWDMMRWRPRLHLSWRGVAAVAAAALIGLFGLNLTRQVLPEARLDLAEEPRPALRGAPVPGAAPAPAPGPRLPRDVAGPAVPGVPAVPGSAAGLPALRQVVRTGQLAIEVERFDEAARRLLQLAEGAGGFVAESATSEQGGARRGTYVLRVPAARFGEVLQQVETLGTVQRRAVSGQDVSEEFVDLDARIRNLERQEARLLSFMDRATKIADLMAIENEVTRVRGEIERLTGRHRVLANRVELATVHVELSEKPKAVPGGFWDAGRAIAQIQGAFLATVRQVLDVGAAAAAFAAGLLPLALLGGAAWAIVRRVTGRATPAA
ncbi:MAG: DUF4349 domain-containing protein [Armatimonadota bacterium]|nr:DUF4349 domain-containing protein [Armatimonadota bacterium]